MSIKQMHPDDEQYDLPAVTVDVVVFSVYTDTLRVLLIERAHEPFEGLWALPGGFVDIDENLAAAARRELAEETGLEDVYLEQLRTFGEPDRDPRMRVISVAYLAMVSSDAAAPEAADDAADAGWFDVKDLPQLAFDHNHILDVALDHLKLGLQITDIAFHLLPEQFALSQLQMAYELILGEMLDKRNFRRKMLQADILEETGDMHTGEGRPARLYRYKGNSESARSYRRLFP